MARLAASAPGPADLLSGPQRGLRDPHRPRLEREGEWCGVRDPLRGPQVVLGHYNVQQAGGQTILEYWIPAEDLDELNANIVGKIEVVAEYPADGR